MPLRILIVDDEPPARENLVHLLAHEAPDAAVQEAANGIEAARVLGAFRPHVLFLDIQMPGLDGLDLMRHVAEEERPVTVFVTAHREFAVDAFEVAAVDYLVKPFRRERFAQALRRAKQALDKVRATKEDGAMPTDRRLRIKDGNRHFLVAPEEVAWISAAGNYVEVHTAEGAYLMRATMKQVHDLLPAGRFVRIHRGILVNRDGIREITATDSGDYQVRLHDGRSLPMSRRRKKAVRDLLGEGREE